MERLRPHRDLLRAIGLGLDPIPAPTRPPFITDDLEALRFDTLAVAGETGPIPTTYEADAAPPASRDFLEFEDLVTRMSREVDDSDAGSQRDQKSRA